MHLMIEMPGKSYRGELSAADDALCALAAELRRDIQRLAVDIGERNVRFRPKQLAQAAHCIEAELSAAGYKPARQEYNVEGTSCCNLDVEIFGGKRPEEIVVIGGHYDTVPGTAGANDNTTGVAATLALARRFAGRKTERTLRFVAFVNEEHPYGHTPLMGSRVYARRCRERGEKVVGMMSLETIGYFDDRPGSQKYPPPVGTYYPSEGNFIAFVGNIASAELVRQTVGAFRTGEPFPCEGAALPESIGRIGDSDHASFWHEGYPGLMVTDTANFRYPYYHTPDDTIDKINFDRLARVVRGLEHVVADLTSASYR
jgi:Zn-dependent M28 family amino/carboxypeptidase